MALVSKTNFKAILLTTTLVGLFSASAIALEAKVEKSVAASAEKVWVAVGDFCGIASWHPAVAKCVLSEKDGKSFRELTRRRSATRQKLHVDTQRQGRRNKLKVVVGWHF
jgi:ADP-heptose:LPS heptosyltransferase